MTKPHLTLVILCGCNRIFGLDGNVTVRDVDARFFDAAPPTCPVSGVPTFAPTLRQIAVQDLDPCTMYVPSESGVAMALCNSTVATGSNDLQLSQIDLDPPPDRILAIRLAPEGTLAVAIVLRGTTQSVEVYEPNAAKRWTMVTTIDLPNANNSVVISTPSRAPERHLVIGVQDPAQASNFFIDEVVGDHDTWQLQTPYPQSDLQLDHIADEIGMTPDGLRMVFEAQGLTSYGFFFSERAALDRPFDAAQQLTQLDNAIAFPYITEDCGRVYFSALDTVLYLEQ